MYSDLNALGIFNAQQYEASYMAPTWSTTLMCGSAVELRPNGTNEEVQFSECAAVTRILGSPPTLAFGYHETGGNPYTQLNASEISEYHQRCHSQVSILTRAYWPGSLWRTRVPHQ